MNQNKLAKIISLIGVAAGIVVIILGIVVMDSYSGSWSNSSTSFGADFYTYSYQATARAGNNIDEVGDMLQQALGFLLIAMGLFDCCYFGLKFAAIPKDVPVETPLSTAPVAETLPEEALPISEPAAFEEEVPAE